MAEAAFAMRPEWPVPGRETFSAILARRAAETPEHRFCVWDGGALTLAELDRRTTRLANSLHALGVRPGDRAALMLEQHPEHVVALCALARLGVVRIPVNMAARGDYLERLFADARPTLIVAETASRAIVEQALQGGATARPRIVWHGTAVAGDAAGDDASPRLAALIENGSAAPVTVEVRPDTVLALSYTSGTTGAPKKFSKTDHALQIGAMGCLIAADVERGDVLLLWEPLFHGAGAQVVLAACIAPITLAMTGSFSASRFWQQARHFGADKVHYIGGVLPMLLKQPPSPEDRSHGVRIAWGGGCPVEIWSAFEERFGVRVHEGYGMTEVANFVCINRGGPVGSIGRALPYFEIRCVDDEGADVPPDSQGQIVVRPRSPAYASRSENSVTVTIGDGWIQTGDLGRMDAQGWLWFEGRKSDSLRRRGENVSAWEVEHVVAQHPEVAECALVGVPSGLGDDDLKLFVRRTPGATLGELDLVRWCETRMPYFHVPRYIAWIDEFPKTPTQRIRKGELSRATDVWDLAASGHVLRR